MKKVKLVRSLFVIVLSFVVIFALAQTSMVSAVDDENVFDFGNEDYQRIEPTNTGNNSSVGNTTDNAVANNTTNNNTAIGNISNNSSTNLSNRNVSNTNGLADTGLSTTGELIALIVVVGVISVIYSYKKVNDYKNL